MTAQQKQRVTWVAALGGVAAAVSIGAALLAGTKGVAKAAAAEQMAPMDRRVTTLEAQRAEDKERLGRMERKIDHIIDRLGGGRKE